MSEKELQVLEIINKNKSISQRDISVQADISVGKVNSIIKKLIEKQYIVIEKVSRKPHYILGSNALAALEKYLKNTANKKIVLHNAYKKDIKQAVILAAGERKEFKKPVGFLEVGDTTIIQRIIDLLKDNGIEKIVVVTGYESKYYEDFAHKENIYLVNNSKYKWTGTMHSLALARNLITDDFLLIENDMVFEERAISEVLKTPGRDCVLITNESGSGDEAFVEIRNNYLFKMSKDIHQFNKIDGEMIGISKISSDIFDKMMEEFTDNKNPYLNYEYALLDVARSYNIGYVKIDDLVWSEVDNLEHYEALRNYIYPRLKRKEMEVKIQSIKQYIVAALNIDENTISSIEPFGGMTNKNYKAVIGDKSYVVRIPGLGTEEMINRRDEKVNSNLAHELYLDTQLIYFNEVSGIKIAEFVENAETLNAMTAKKENNMKLTTEILKRLHSSDITMSNEFNVFDKIEHYESLLKKVDGKNFNDYYEVKDKVKKLKNLLIKLGAESKPCHNDTVPENFIKSGEDKVYLIDWEYSGMNDPMWDLAAHSLECGFSEDDEELFLQIYFNGIPHESFRERILIHKVCQDFLWSIWTNIKEAKGDDFGTYGRDRYNRCKSNLSLLENRINL